MPKYALYRFDGPPPKTSPVGMNDLMGMGTYVSPDNAMKYLLRRVLGPHRIRVFGTGKDATHLGLYRLDVEDTLVKVQKLG